MSSDTLLRSSVNWSLFIFTSLLICLRRYLPTICLWILNKFYSPSATIHRLTNELKDITRELNTISQQDEFAAYTRKDRQRLALVQRLKDERTGIETKEKNLSTYIRLILNVVTVLMLIFLTLTGRKHESVPLFNFPFFRFPLIIWIMSLNTFVSTLADIYIRYRTNKKTTE